MAKITKPARRAPAADTIEKLRSENAVLKHQVKELQARVRGETKHARKGWEHSHERDKAIIVLTQILAEQSRLAGHCNPVDEIPF